MSLGAPGNLRAPGNCLCLPNGKSAPALVSYDIAY